MAVRQRDISVDENTVIFPEFVSYCMLVRCRINVKQFRINKASVYTGSLAVIINCADPPFLTIHFAPYTGPTMIVQSIRLLTILVSRFAFTEPV